MIMNEFYKWLTLSLCLFVAVSSHAQRITVLKKSLDGSKGELLANASIEVKDSVFFSGNTKLSTPYAAKNIIVFHINEYSGRVLPDTFNAVAKVRVIYKRPDGVMDSVDQSLQINYSKNVAYTSRSSFVFNSTHQVTLKLLSLSISNDNDKVINSLLLDNEMDVQVTYALNCTDDAVQSISATATANTDSTDELTVSWPALTGADEYDLEWTYVDSSALAANKYGHPINPVLLFRNNASRVTIPDISYSIPLLYDGKGTLFFRVRAVQDKSSYARIETPWSSSFSGGLGSFDFVGHQRALNWNSKVSFAEEGKRNVVVSYYDGSLRSRQTVTKDNTTNTTIVGEKLYDYQGRETIQVMPSPTLSSVIKYSRNFNRGLNGEYDKSNYDTLPTPEAFLTASAAKMSTESGANQYYSSNNPQKDSGMNRYIPDAGGYAFTETVYTQDNTNRISRQGGLGETFKLGGNHETKYYYDAPNDNDLDVLFGTEAGDKSHYFKNTVQDANGQMSVSYVDMHGRTVATALAGVADSADLENLSSNIGFTVTDTLSRAGSNTIKDLTLESTHSQLVTQKGDYHFHYSLTPPVLRKPDCNGDTVCYNGLYDLEITITDDVYNQHLGGKPYQVTYHNFKADSIIANCGTPESFVADFTLQNLEKGSYMITKRLTVNREAMAYYRDSIFMLRNLCTTLSQIIQEQRDLQVNTTCVPDCQSCRDSVGDWNAFRTRYLTKAGIPTQDSAEYRAEALTAYNEAVDACNGLCNTISPVDEMKTAMLEDMSPSSGQYANVEDSSDIYSIFYSDDNDSEPLYSLKSLSYKSATGTIDSVYDESVGGFVLPQSLSAEDFSAKFKPSWASALLQYHPEYCKFLVYQSYESSLLWDRRFEAVNTYAAARDSGFLNPTGNSSIPFKSVTANIDPMAATQATMLNKKLKFYSDVADTTKGISMYSVSTIGVKCVGLGSDCVATYKTMASAFNESTMCDGDLDMAWRTFRELYLATKTRMLDSLIQLTKCTATTNELIAAGKSVHFTDYSKALISSGISYIASGDSTKAKDSVAANLAATYASNCQSYVSTWLSQLQTCAYYDTSVINQIFIPKMLAVCKAGADATHVMGSSTVAHGSTNSYSSFQQIIDEYNVAHNITDTLNCNYLLVTAPLPYDAQAVYAESTTYAKPTACECTTLSTLQLEYKSFKKSTDTTFAAYLNRTRNTTLTASQLDALLSACDPKNAACTYVTPAITIPAIIQCNTAAACASCTTIQDLYNSFKSTYPSLKPTKEEGDSTMQQQVNSLFAAYMNNHTGFSKQAWEYLTFIEDTCTLYTSKDSSVCVNNGILHTYNSGEKDMIYDMQRTKDGGYIMAGHTTTGSDQDGYLLKADSTGNVVWAKKYKANGNEYFNRMKPTFDGGYIAVGTVTNTGTAARDLWLVKTNDTGKVVWSKRLGFNTANGEVGQDVIQQTDSSFAFIGKTNFYGSLTDGMIGVVSADGTAQWIRQFGYNSGDEGYSLVQNGDTLVAFGCALYLSYYRPILAMFNRYNGTVEKLTRFSHTLDGFTSIGNYSGYINKTSAGYALNIANTTSAGKTNNSFLGISNSGGVLYNKWMSAPLDSVSTQIMPTSVTLDGGLIAAENFTYGGKTQVVFRKFNADKTIGLSNWMKVDSSLIMYRVFQRTDSSYAGSGGYNNGAFLLFTQPSGLRGCSDSAVKVTLNTLYTSYSTTDTFAINYKLETSYMVDYSVTAISVHPIHKKTGCDGTLQGCYTLHKGPLLCGNSTPVFGKVAVNSVTNCTDNEFFAVSKGTEIYNAYKDSLNGSFDADYLAMAIAGGQREVFTVSYSTSEYHYTLYYYDQAGNLVKTIPPAGVVIDRSADWVNRVRAARAAGITLVPAHRMATQYRYNTLNQVVSKVSPDGGVSHFWYDRLGRLSLSQDAKQRPDNKYSYTTYDALGRINEVGELTSAAVMNDFISRDTTLLSDWLAAANNSRKQITKTTYDVAYSSLSQLYLTPGNLRNRVSWTALFNDAASQDTMGFAKATFYSYDVHGNVDTLLQDYKQGGMQESNNRFKKMVYGYDLISGKVNEVGYQPGQRDAFYHRYSYDALNRITNVETSRDSINWDNDAYYQYYKHGPLSRMVLGQEQVQGVDYGYTLQGWLKGVNSTAVTHGYDPGGDGGSGTQVAKDVFGFALHYYGGMDYSPIGTVYPFASGTNLKPLYNGNISAISQNLPSVGTPLQSNYSYDVLNRLTGMQVSRGLNTGTNMWEPEVLDDFKERVSYDANGNILSYRRNGNHSFAGTPLGMDSMRYTYKTGTNQLDFVYDSVGASNYENDIDGQMAGNYQYDAIGNLRSDQGAGIDSIEWTVYGKIRRIKKSNGSEIRYTYDALGNRVSKRVNGVETWYVRDAAGNVMSIYTKGEGSINNGALSQTEAHLYGSSRLGIKAMKVNVEDGNVLPGVNMPGLGSGININFTRGEKFFELSNHLGNVLVTVLDRRIGISKDGIFVDHYEPAISSSQEYYPFGMLMPGRQSGGGYRYGFNGQERDDHIAGSGNNYTAEFWEYDTRIGRRWNLDPRPEDGVSMYSVLKNAPIMFYDLLGDTSYKPLSKPVVYQNYPGNPYLNHSKKYFKVAQDIASEEAGKAATAMISVGLLATGVGEVGLTLRGLYAGGELLTANGARLALGTFAKNVALDLFAQTTTTSILNRTNPIKALKDANLTATFLSGLGLPLYSSNIIGNMFQYSYNGGLQTTFDGKVSLFNYAKSVGFGVAFGKLGEKFGEKFGDYATKSIRGISMGIYMSGSLSLGPKVATAAATTFYIGATQVSPKTLDITGGILDNLTNSKD
jgi:YD repeat-containing protein